MLVSVHKLARPHKWVGHELTVARRSAPISTDHDSRSDNCRVALQALWELQVGSSSAEIRLFPDSFHSRARAVPPVWLLTARTLRHLNWEFKRRLETDIFISPVVYRKTELPIRQSGSTSTEHSNEHVRVFWRLCCHKPLTAKDYAFRAETPHIPLIAT